MTKRIRGTEFKTVTAVFLLLVGVFVILGAYDLGRQSGEAIGKNAANSYQYSQHADELIAGCLSLAERTAIPVCVREVIESTNEQKRAEADLVAQKQMGLWSLGMLVMSTFMFLVTAVGVWWIRDTLVETRRAVKAADDAVTVTREIGQAQSRAYITFREHSLNLELTPVYGPNPQGQKGSVDIVISGKVKNSGQTPAWNVGALAQIGVAPKGTYADLTQLFSPKEFVGTALEFGVQDERTYDIPMSVKADIPKVKNGSHIIWGAIQMKYTDIFDVTVRTRIMSFYIKGIDVDDPTLVWDVLIKTDGAGNQGKKK